VKVRRSAISSVIFPAVREWNSPRLLPEELRHG
jgi:hypothetical protein